VSEHLIEHPLDVPDLVEHRQRREELRSPGVRADSVGGGR
jgi:hypothetical protein